MKPSRSHACYLLMNHALLAPQVLELTNERLAENYRFQCYAIRRALRLGGDARFDGLRIKVKGAMLTVEMKDEGQIQG